MAKLLDVAKKMREKNTQIKMASEKVLVQNVEWDLDPSFIGEPMVPRVLKRLSQYVDQRLTDYSSIYGANPATNMPKVRLDYEDHEDENGQRCSNFLPGNITMGHNPERPADTVDGDEFDENDFPTGNTTEVTRKGPYTPAITREAEKFYAPTPLNENGSTIIDDPHLFDAAEKFSISNLRVHPPAGRESEGSIIDDPELFDAAGNSDIIVRQHQRTEQREPVPQEGIADEYRPQLEAYNPEEAEFIEDEHVASESEDLPISHPDPGTVQMWADRFRSMNIAGNPVEVKEQDTLFSSKIKLPDGSSLLRESEENPEEDIHVLHSTEPPYRIQTGIVYTKQSSEPIPVPSVASLLNQKELNHAASILLQAATEEVEASSEPGSTPENLTMLLPGTTEGAVFSDSGEIVYPDRVPEDGIQEALDANEAEAHFANTGEVLFQPSPSPGISLGRDIHDGVEIVPAEDQGILHGNDYHHEMAFNEVAQRGRAAGTQVDGINPANFRLDNEYFNNGAEGIDPTRVGVDNHVYSTGALPGVRFRVRDSFIRNRHLTLKVPQFELMGPGSKGKDIAYVTSYTIEHQTHKIKARIITAQPDLTLDDELWFELCTNGDLGDSTLKAVVKNTVQANLCIYKPSRVAFYGRNVDARAEKIALETLRDMITEQEFRHYLRYGFLTVRGSSGRVYQIPRDGHHTKIWEQGKMIEEVCVRIKDNNVPPTDNVIAFKVMVETNEEMFKALGNVYKNKEAA